MFGGYKGELIPYDIICKRNIYEIRRYQKCFLVQNTFEVQDETDYSFETNDGFHPLFRYFNRHNNRKEKLHMTVPFLIQQLEIDSTIKRKISFILSPSKFDSLNQIPIPIDEHIEIIEQFNLFDMACITFDKSMSKETLHRKEKQLRKAAQHDGLHLSSYRNNILYLGYNPPLTMSYFQKNDICIPIISSLNDFK